MALLFMDSFDNYATPAIGALGKWQTVQDAAAIMSIASGQGRNGTNCLKLTGSATTGSTGSFMQQVLSSSMTGLVVGVAVNVTTFSATTNHGFLRFLDVTTPQVTLDWLPTGQLRVLSGDSNGTTLGTSTASVLSATNVYFYIEIKIVFNGSTGTVDVHANGSPITGLVGLTGLNTAPSGNNNANTIQLGSCKPVSTGAAIDTCFFEDFYIVSTSGGQNTTFLNDVRVVCVFPNGAGASTQFTPNGAATNWQCVNEVSEDSGATFVSDSTVSDEDLYTKQSIPTNTGQIFGIQQCAVAQKDAASGRSLANINLSGPTTTAGATHVLTQSYAWYLDIFEQDPNASSAWTFNSFQAAQVGVKVAA